MSCLSARLCSVLVLIGGLSVAPVASAWWNDDWSFRKELTLDLSAAGANIPASATDVPVLVRLSIANFPYFADAKPDGSDLRLVAADDKTPLKFHIEKFDAQAQIALLWVRLPQVTGGVNADKFFLYYGNAEGTSASDAAGTYDTNQALAYHFAAASPAPQDSTGYKSEATIPDGAIEAASLIGSGLRLDGSSSFTVPATPALRLVAAQGYTMSAWLRIDEAQRAEIVTLGDAARALVLGIDGERATGLWRDGGRQVRIEQPTGSLIGEWHHVALRVANNTLSLWIDGVEAAKAEVALQEVSSPLIVGGSTGGFLRAQLDELQAANAGRSDAWLRAAATSQGMVAPLLVYGGDAQKEGDHDTSYFASTLRNVTVDGWAIIAVLAVMFVAAVLIMGTKLLHLGRVQSGNRRFLDAFNQLSDDPTLLETPDSGQKYGISTLWTLYHHGTRETMKRVEGRAAGAERVKTLSPQSIEAIRATLDATLIRSTQRLQSQMVWLTIAIAGGPFLGLLGTVVGVMITFAAIAASGEVNVNAIAPGTAAALVATVAGLGVAIPCLFGYNYLNTRIKEGVADMRVFVDEFVTRIAETYS